jgi:hypothetical protein
VVVASSTCAKRKGTKIATVAPGIRTGIGVINRGAGQIQVTYKHQPLYTFIGDQQAGQTNGQGFKDFAVSSSVADVDDAPGKGKRLSRIRWHARRNNGPREVITEP